MNNGNIYLSGGMQFKSDLGATWRKETSDVLKKMGFFPLDICELDRIYAEKHGNLFYSTKEDDMLDFKASIRRHFVYADIKMIKEDTDVVIVLYDDAAQRGFGTAHEIALAYEFGIPIFLVSMIPQDKMSGWLLSIATKVFFDFDSLYSYFSTLPSGILKKDVYGNRHVGKHYLCSLCGSVFEKEKHHFVSFVSPLYCKNCVESIAYSYEDLVDRYDFFKQTIEGEKHAVYTK